MSEPVHRLGDVGRRVTLQTIADELQCSRSTVSNAYNRPDQLNPELRRRILETAGGFFEQVLDALRGSSGDVRPGSDRSRREREPDRGRLAGLRGAPSVRRDGRAGLPGGRKIVGEAAGGGGGERQVHGGPSLLNRLSY